MSTIYEGATPESEQIRVASTRQAMRTTTRRKRNPAATQGELINAQAAHAETEPETTLAPIPGNPLATNIATNGGAPSHTAIPADLDPPRPSTGPQPDDEYEETPENAKAAPKPTTPPICAATGRACPLNHAFPPTPILPELEKAPALPDAVFLAQQLARFGVEIHHWRSAAAAEHRYMNNWHLFADQDFAKWQRSWWLTQFPNSHQNTPERTTKKRAAADSTERGIYRRDYERRRGSQTDTAPAAQHDPTDSG